MNNQIETISMPYNWGYRSKANTAAGKAVFFGSDFKNLRHSNTKELARLTNQCLDYIRRNCSGLKFYYKPHPGETDEHTLLNLEGFELVRDKNNAEMFLYKHRDEIKYVFSQNSTASATGFSFGINSYVFLEPFRQTVGTVTTDYWRQTLFAEMPDNFFIKSFNQSLVDNRLIIAGSKIPESLAEIITENPPTIWFIVNDSRFALTAALLAQHIKQLNPEQRLTLVVSLQQRWRLIDFDWVKSHFDAVIEWPRVFYSVKPGRILESLKLAWRVRNFPTDPADIIFGLGGCELVENAFLSYHLQNKKYAFLMQLDIDMHYSPEKNFFRQHPFHWTKAGWFYNHLLEPLLGLHRTMFLQNTEGNPLNLVRYEWPINDIYERVFVFSLKP